MGFEFWFVRAVKVYLGVAVLLFIIRLLKDNSILESFTFAILWAFVSTVIFIGSRVYHSRKGVKCALCNDTPESGGKKS